VCPNGTALTRIAYCGHSAQYSHLVLIIELFPDHASIKVMCCYAMINLLSHGFICVDLRGRVCRRIIINIFCIFAILFILNNSVMSFYVTSLMMCLINLFTSDDEVLIFVLLWLPVWFLRQTVNCRRFCFWHHQSVFFVCVWNIPGTAEQICVKFTWKTRLVPRLDEFEGQGQRSKSPVTKMAFLCPSGGLHAVCVWLKN